MAQMASWGFVVVASTDPTTATGDEMLAGIDYLLARNSDPASVFYGHLNPHAIGAFGHSQGAGGTVNTASRSALVKTAVPINLPAYKWVGEGGDFCVACLKVPTLYLGGSLDKVVAPPTTTVGYYTQTTAPAAVGVLKGAGHNTIQDAGEGYLGYLTAWMMWQLQGDLVAATAFLVPAGKPELNLNTGWQNQAEKNLNLL